LSKEVDVEQLREMIEREIEELERRLQLLQMMLQLLEECGAPAGLPGGREFRDPEGRLVAKLVASRDRVMLIFHRPVRETNPYIRYALRALARIAEENEGLEYSVEKENGNIKSITVLGVTKDTVDDVTAALEYAAMKLARLARS